jgi:hypothetical protein
MQFLLFLFRYHHFRVKPPVGKDCMLQLKREGTSKSLRNSVLVCLPDGKSIGRIPKELSEMITRGLQMGAIEDSFPMYTGEMQHDGSIRVGGPKLCAAYVLRMRDSDITSFGNALGRKVGTPFVYYK